MLTWELVPLAVAATLTAILGVARLTRILVYDDFPPAAWWRATWEGITKGNSWNKLFNCWWCLSPWIALVCIGWWLVGTLVPWVAVAWWVWWGMLAIGYVATMVIVRDEPSE